MFDVHWVDPSENVGQRRARKKAEAEKAGKRKDDEKSTRTSVSTRRSSSSADKAFGFFGGRSSSKKSSTSSSSKLTQLRTPSLDTKLRQDSLKVVTPVSTAHSSQLAPVQHTEGNYDPERIVESGRTSPDRSSKDSIFSKWTDHSGATIASISGGSVAGSGYGKSYLQDLGGGSYVTKTTEYSFEKQTSDAHEKGFLSGITITADPSYEAPTSPVFKQPQTPTRTPQPDKPTVPRSPSTHSSAPTLKGRHPRETMPLPPIPNYALTRFSKTQKKKESWKAPDAWETRTSEADTSSSSIGEEDEMMMMPVVEEEEDSLIALDLTNMQRQIKRMANASASVIYLHLNETWANAHEPGMELELELEKKRWMLAAIHQLDVKTPNDQIDGILPRKNVPRVDKILALFESSATASYLAALRNYAPVFHLSVQPLSHKIYPNIHPIQCPIVTSAALSVAPRSFAEVYCLSLPSLVPSSDIPQMLRGIHRCLAPGGSLRLILVDPAPQTSTMGPCLRAWLEKHLLLNLEKKFRCMNPTKLFPDWLQEVSLRGKGSTIVKPKFRAIAVDPPASTDPKKPIDITTQLYSQVGKMLWMEVWGSYVTAEKWWWEDRECVKECVQLDTAWEYNIITAVREDRE